MPFSTLDPASGYTVSHIFGFVEELVVTSDPEFLENSHNTSSFSNFNGNARKIKSTHETRQTLLHLLDSAVRRKMCKTVLDRGGNAVLGYHQNFDEEGDSGIVARTYGTCVRLERRQQQPKQPPTLQLNHRGVVVRDDEDDDDDDDDDDEHSPARRGNRKLGSALALPDSHHHTDDDEVQLLTLRDFDPRVRVRIGGLVTARSVKYLGNLASKLSDQETRDSWWTELRDEIRSHAKILCCSHVVGYQEASTIHDDVAVLSITGTACTVRGLPDLYLQQQPRLWESYPVEMVDGTTTAIKTNKVGKGRRTPNRSERKDRRMRRAAGVKSGKKHSNDRSNTNSTNNETSYSSISRGEYKRGTRFQKSRGIIRARNAKPCSYCHVPYHHRVAPFTNMKLVPCILCGKRWVPKNGNYSNIIKEEERNDVQFVCICVLINALVVNFFLQMGTRSTSCYM